MLLNTVVQYNGCERGGRMEGHQVGRGEAEQGADGSLWPCSVTFVIKLVHTRGIGLCVRLTLPLL